MVSLLIFLSALLVLDKNLNSDYNVKSLNSDRYRPYCAAISVVGCVQGPTGMLVRRSDSGWKNRLSKAWRQ